MSHKPLPDDLSSTPFVVADALARGVGAGRLRGADLQRPFRGVRVSVPTAALDAYCVRLAPGQFFTHTTAARVLGLPLPPRLDHPLPLHVGVVKPARAPRIGNVVGHHSDAGTVSLLDVDRTRRHAGRRGARALSAAGALVRANTDSVRETLLRLIIVQAGLPEPSVNPAIFDGDGAFLAFGDLAYPEWKVLVEYDGEQHRLDERQYQRDVERLDALAEAGWRIIRVTKANLWRPGYVATKVHTALVAAGWRP